MKKYIKIFLLIFLLGSGYNVKAQPQFITAGKIEFEKRTNQHSLLEDESMWDEMMKKNLPKFAVTYFDLYFNEEKSLYKTGRDPDNRMIHWGLSYISNTVYKDLKNETFVNQKNIFGSDFLISDSIQKIDWKITNEPRTIAGFECRKAVGRIFDSIVVIAFYTDEILPSSGPESFGGLPGMILGLAIPRMHTTWYATKLEVREITTKEAAVPKEGKKFNEKQFRVEMQDILKERDWLKKMQWQMLI
ncbi:GLPGLI family protein [Pollutibacter soli]|uniref:GLPGLI family protein n=1 Tax=Pollutibacter soli TaxID=3034157 RepID=UPI003013B3E8